MHRHAEGALQLLHHLRRQRSRGRPHEAQRRAYSRSGRRHRAAPASPGAWWARRCTRWARIPPASRRTTARRNPGVHTTLPPAASEESTAADQAVNVEQRHHVQAAILGRQGQRARRCARRGHRLRCVSGTIFGRAVVPEVCRISATSSGKARHRRGGDGSNTFQAEHAGRVRLRPRATPRTGMPRAARHRRDRRIAARFHQQELGLQVRK